MRMPLAQFAIATPQCGAQFVVQFAEVREFAMNVRKLSQQFISHRGTRLQAAISHGQEAAYLGEGKSETLCAADKAEGLNIAFGVPAETALGSRQAWQEAVAFVETNRVNGQPNLLCDNPNLHWPAPSKTYTLECRPESRPIRWYRRMERILPPKRAMGRFGATLFSSYFSVTRRKRLV